MLLQYAAASDAAVDLNVQAGAAAPQFAHLGHRLGHEGLAAKAGLDRHDEHHAERHVLAAADREDGLGRASAAERTSRRPAPPTRRSSGTKPVAPAAHRPNLEPHLETTA